MEQIREFSSGVHTTLNNRHYLESMNIRADFISRAVFSLYKGS